MARYPVRWTACALLAVVVGAGMTGCSDDGNGNGGNPTSAASKAASAASSLASRGADALASATASAGKKLDEVKGGLDAKDAVRLGRPTTADGHASVQVTADNSASSTKSFGVQVNFTDSGGNLLDTVLVTLSDVPAGKSGDATARSNRSLSGQVKAEVARAVRY